MDIHRFGKIIATSLFFLTGMMISRKYPKETIYFRWVNSSTQIDGAVKSFIFGWIFSVKAIQRVAPILGLMIVGLSDPLGRWSAGPLDPLGRWSAAPPCKFYRPWHSGLTFIRGHSDVEYGSYPTGKIQLRLVRLGYEWNYGAGKLSENPVRIPVVSLSWFTGSVSRNWDPWESQDLKGTSPPNTKQKKVTFSRITSSPLDSWEIDHQNPRKKTMYPLVN